MAKESVRDRIAYRFGRVECALAGCELAAQGIGKYCDKHDRVNYNTGSPVGRTVKKYELRPWKKTARKYVKRNIKHPAITAALRWIEALVYARRPHAYTGKLLRANATPRERLDRWLQVHKEQSINPVDWLAVIVAMFYMGEYDRGAFVSNRHFKHQLAIQLLRLAKAPKVPHWKGGEGGWRYDRISVGTRELLSDKIINSGVGVLALRIGTILVAKTAPRDQDLLHGINTPLPGEQAKSTSTT